MSQQLRDRAHEVALEHGARGWPVASTVTDAVSDVWEPVLRSVEREREHLTVQLEEEQGRVARLTNELGDARRRVEELERLAVEMELDHERHVLDLERRCSELQAEVDRR